MKKFTLIFSALFILFSTNVNGSGVDSLNITNTFITVGETWYNDYFTNYSVYNERSLFKDESGGIHTTYISNYKLYYAVSLDSGTTWLTEQITSTYDGDFKEAILYADEDGNPYIAVTINPYFNYGNPTGITYGDEFRYSVLFFYKEGLIWQEQEVFDSTVNTGFSGNYGCRVGEVYKNMDDEMVILGTRYGWYTYGGELYEFTRNTEGVWSDISIIHTFSDTPIDHATDLVRTYLKDNGERDLIFSRPYNPIGIPELMTMHFDGSMWLDPVVVTTDLLNYRAYHFSVGTDEEMYLIYYSNDPSPHIYMETDFEDPVDLDIDMTLIDTIQVARIHATKNGLLDLLVYPLNSDTVFLFVSEDNGLTWGEPMYLDRGIMPGILPVCDQFSDQGSDLEYIRVNRVSNGVPYGPDSLFYYHIEQVNTTSLGIADVEVSEDNFLFYPNPFMEELTIEYDLVNASELNIKIYNLQGKVVMNRNYNAVSGKTTLKIDLGDLDAGTYIVEVLEEDNQLRIAEKILKMPVN